MGSYGFIYKEKKVLLAQGQYIKVLTPHHDIQLSNIVPVITLYHKTGGKNGKHSAIVEATNVASVSRIGVRVFEHTHGPHFRSNSSNMFQTRAFALLSHHHFLTLLSSSPTSTATGNQATSIITITKKDLTCFQTLSAVRSELEKAMKEFRKRQKDSEEDHS